MNNDLNFQFGMYEPSTDSIIVNTGENTILVIRCKEYNSSVIFDEPNDIVYLYRLAEESPLTYASVLSETLKPYFSRILKFSKSQFHLYFSFSFCNIFPLHNFWFPEKFLEFSKKT